MGGGGVSRVRCGGIAINCGWLADSQGERSVERRYYYTLGRQLGTLGERKGERASGRAAVR